MCLNFHTIIKEGKEEKTIAYANIQENDIKCRVLPWETVLTYSPLKGNYCSFGEKKKKELNYSPRIMLFQIINW